MYWFRGLHLVISPIFTANFYGQILHVFLLNLLWCPQGSLGYQQIAQSGRETTRRHLKAKKRRWKSKYQYFHALFWHLQNIYNLIREFENNFGFDLRLWLLIKGVNNVRSRGIWKKKQCELDLSRLCHPVSHGNSRETLAWAFPQISRKRA